MQLNNADSSTTESSSKSTYFVGTWLRKFLLSNFDQVGKRFKMKNIVICIQVIPNMSQCKEGSVVYHVTDTELSMKVIFTPQSFINANDSQDSDVSTSSATMTSSAAMLLGCPVMLEDCRLNHLTLPGMEYGDFVLEVYNFVWERNHSINNDIEDIINHNSKYTWCSDDPQLQSLLKNIYDKRAGGLLSPHAITNHLESLLEDLSFSQTTRDTLFIPPEIEAAYSLDKPSSVNCGKKVQLEDQIINQVDQRHDIRSSDSTSACSEVLDNISPVQKNSQHQDHVDSDGETPEFICEFISPSRNGNNCDIRGQLLSHSISNNHLNLKNLQPSVLLKRLQSSDVLHSVQDRTSSVKDNTQTHIGEKCRKTSESTAIFNSKSPLASQNDCQHADLGDRGTIIQDKHLKPTESNDEKNILHVKGGCHSNPKARKSCPKWIPKTVKDKKLSTPSPKKIPVIAKSTPSPTTSPQNTKRTPLSTTRTFTSSAKSSKTSLQNAKETLSSVTESANQPPLPTPRKTTSHGVCSENLYDTVLQNILTPTQISLPLSDSMQVSTSQTVLSESPSNKDHTSSKGNKKKSAFHDAFSEWLANPKRNEDREMPELESPEKCLNPTNADSISCQSAAVTKHVSPNKTSKQKPADLTNEGNKICTGNLKPPMKHPSRAIKNTSAVQKELASPVQGSTPVQSGLLGTITDSASYVPMVVLTRLPPSLLASEACIRDNSDNGRVIYNQTPSSGSQEDQRCNSPDLEILYSSMPTRNIKPEVNDSVAKNNSNLLEMWIRSKQKENTNVGPRETLQTKPKQCQTGLASKSTTQINSSPSASSLETRRNVSRSNKNRMNPNVSFRATKPISKAQEKTLPTTLTPTLSEPLRKASSCAIQNIPDSASKQRSKKIVASQNKSTQDVSTNTPKKRSRTRNTNNTSGEKQCDDVNRILTGALTSTPTIHSSTRDTKRGEKRQLDAVNNFYSAVMENNKRPRAEGSKEENQNERLQTVHCNEKRKTGKDPDRTQTTGNVAACETCSLCESRSSNPYNFENALLYRILEKIKYICK